MRKRPLGDGSEARLMTVTTRANQALCETIWVLAARSYSMHKGIVWKYFWSCALVNFTYAVLTRRALRMEPLSQHQRLAPRATGPVTFISEKVRSNVIMSRFYAGEA